MHFNKSNHGPQYPLKLKNNNNKTTPAPYRWYSLYVEPFKQTLKQITYINMVHTINK